MYEKVKVNKPTHNLFNLSHEVRQSGKMGKLMPFLCQQCMPGDVFRGNAEMMCRFAPMIAPIMHRVDIKFEYFKVPLRILWDQWEEFFTGGPDGVSAPEFPQFHIQENPYDCVELMGASTLADYMGIGFAYDDISQGDILKFSALPFRAYQMIYNEWYRDQNIEDEIEIDTSGGVQDPEDFVETYGVLRNRAWQKDYFTSCLPTPQRGPDVLLPLGTTDIIYDLPDNYDGDRYVRIDPKTGAEYPPLQGGGNVEFTEDGHGVLGENHLGENPVTGSSAFVSIDNSEALSVQASSISVNTTRLAFAVQRLGELSARGGARYTETLQTLYGIRSSDGRLQRPEYLAGGSTPVNISEVLQTSQTDSSPQGHMAGHAIAFDKSNRFFTFCEEHCYIIGLVSIVPKTGYFQGMPRHFQRFDRLDFPMPQLANLGEQEVKVKELYCTGGQNDEKTLGYQSRYAEEKTMPDRVAGEMKTTLKHWHMATDFGGTPGLNEDLIHCDPTNRIWAVTDPDIDNIYLDIWNDIQAKRLLPKYGIPSIV